MTIDFKGAYGPKAVILRALFFYARYAASERDLKEILAERGVAADHATLNRWAVKYAPMIAHMPRPRSDLQVFPGGWTKFVSRARASGRTIIEQSTNVGKPLI